ncbi:MAG: PAS domain S-box protein, partial [Deltaproteobacteria bacterium]|nr:PAS domain S-box protein [Deltaproteobacteria bacterium]
MDFSQIPAADTKGLFLTDSKGDILKINAVFTGILGYSEEDIVGMSISELRQELPHDSLNTRECRMSFKFYYLNLCETQSIYITLQSKRGTMLPVRLRSIIERGPGGETTAAIGIIEMPDADDSAAEPGPPIGDEIWETKENYRSILENSGDAIIITDFNSRIVTVNAAALIMLECRSERELLDRYLIELAPYDGVFSCATGERREFGEQWRLEQVAISDRLFKNGRAKFETYLIRQKDKIFPVEITVTILRSPSGEPRGTISICRDITRRRIAEKELQSSHALLEQEVAKRTRELNDANTALRVMLQQGQNERAGVEEQVFENVNKTILPYIEILKNSRLDDRQAGCLSVLEANLDEIVSGFSGKVATARLNLTPIELKVANLVKLGKTTKE